MAESFDFQIDGLKFRAATSDRFPYARGTAPFRKEQFDAAATVGDQSLTGWWTRGQLSFHKGAGLTYYEVLDGDEVLNRYNDSLRVDVGDPGRAVLTPALSPLGVAATKAVPGTLSGAAGMFALTSTGVKFRGGATTTAMASSDGGVPSDITSDGRYFYVCNGSKIERQSSAVLGRTNHVTNPNFETNLTGWTVTGSTQARDTTTFYSGTASLALTRAAGYSSTTFTLTGLTVGVTYKLTARVRISATGTGTIVRFNSTSNQKTVTTTGAWTLVEIYRTATSASEPVFLEDFGGTGTVWLDNVMVTESPFDGDYFDGSSPGGAWTGTANASKSSFASSAPASSNVLWTHTQAGATFKGVWWAKGRLWALDNSGRWYTLSTVGGSVKAEDAFWVSGKVEGSWALAEGPSVVYVAHDSDVYGVALSGDGSVPTLEVPIVVATIPANETISCLEYYLGHLMIATNAGVRVGVTSQSGDLVYGPLVIEGNFSSSNAAGKRDSRIYVAGVPDGHTNPTVCVLDLGHMVSDLLPAWFPYHGLGTSTSTRSGVTLSPDGTVYAWAASALYGSGATLAATGTLTTGFHRFGTLESKHFAGVKIRAQGTGGTVRCFLLEQNGTETELLTIDLATESGGEVSLVNNPPLEAAALRLELTRDPVDPANGPELLGYQIKALPSPIRQRLIRWPVVVADVVSGRYGVPKGRNGDAWVNWSALETLEESDALVTYTDHRTGETGYAYIESLELEGNTPSSRTTSGFGGVGQITLRKVS